MLQHFLPYCKTFCYLKQLLTEIKQKLNKMYKPKLISFQLVNNATYLLFIYSLTWRTTITKTKMEVNYTELKPIKMTQTQN